MLSEMIWHFSKIADFWVFWWYFWVTQNRRISRVSKVTHYFDSNSWTKNASTFDEVSIESSEFRAFEWHLIGGASYFSSRAIPILALRKCYFLGPRISKTSKLVALRRPLSVQKVVCPPPKSRLKNTFSRGSRNFWAAKWAATRVHFSSHRFDIWDYAGVSLTLWAPNPLWAPTPPPPNWGVGTYFCSLPVLDGVSQIQFVAECWTTVWHYKIPESSKNLL